MANNITLTKSAAVFIQKFIDADKTKDKEVQGVRLGVKSTGCSGLSYYLEPVKETREADQVFESHGVLVFVEAKALPYLKGTEIDCIQEGLGEYLKFNNPNVKGACGCGESFTVESTDTLEAE